MKNKQTRREFGATALATIAASVMPAPMSLQRRKIRCGRDRYRNQVGQTVPHSGPGSLYGVLGRVGEAYFQMLNEKGGINGRKVKFFTMDDAYSAPKCGRRHGGWSSRKKCWRCSARSAPRRRPPCTNISTPSAAAAQHRRLEMERPEEL